MSPRQSLALRAHQRRGFTLIELLVVVLIIGILAAIALPRFLGQRTRAKNAAAQAAVRHALVAARSYYTQNSETYAGLGPAELRGYESSLSGTEAADGQQPGASGANPQDIWIGNGLDANNPTSGDANGGNTVVLCSVSRGDTVYCVRDVGGVTTYLQSTSSVGSAGVVAASSWNSGGWSSSNVAATPAYDAAVLATSGLQSFWKLDETSGTAVADSKGSIAGTITGLSLGQSGYLSLAPAFSSPGSGSNYVSFGDNYAFNGTQSFTFETWIRPGASPTSGRIIAKEQNRDFATHSITTYQGWSLSLVGGKLYYERDYSTSSYSYITGSTTLASGTWYHVAVVYDSSTSPYMKLYVNGANDNGTIAGTNPAPYTVVTPTPTSSAPLRLFEASDLSPWAPLNARLMRAAIYNVPLSAATLLAHYQAAA